MSDLDLPPDTLETDMVKVRTLTPADLDWVVRIDAEHSGLRRRKYYELKLREAERDTGIRVSLAASLEGEEAGFLMARLYYGEFGQPEPVAILDSIAVSRRHQKRHVGGALMRQLLMNLRALGIDQIHTEVDWNQFAMLRFFEKTGFRPAPRLCLECHVHEPT